MQASGRPASGLGTVAAEEVARFDALADRWWDPGGPMRALHQMNPLRIGWIIERVRRHWPQSAGLALLDVGCGAGLAAEALARAGFEVTGLDAASAAIAAARAHAEGSFPHLSYRAGAPEDLLREPGRFAVITALEVIEHVADRQAFLGSLAALLEPGGLLFLSTLNRTSRSLLTAKLGAEYVLRLLPRGTHDWRRFITPAELGTELRRAGLRAADLAGMVFDPLSGRWRISRNMSVNYIMLAQAP